jgi:hypothetical protein
VQRPGCLKIGGAVAGIMNQAVLEFLHNPLVPGLSLLNRFKVLERVSPVLTKVLPIGKLS